MSIEKSELKKEVTQEIGSRLDDALEEGQREIHRWEGAKTSLGGAKLAIEQLFAHVAQDVKVQRLSNEGAEAAQSYIRKAAGILDNLRLKAEVHEQRAYGRVDGLKQAVTTTKKIYDAEDAKVAALAAHVEEDVPPTPGPAEARPVGARPGNKIAALKASEGSGSDADADRPPSEPVDASHA